MIAWNNQYADKTASIGMAHRVRNEAVELLEAGILAEGETRLRRAVELVESVAGPDDLETMKLLSDLATTLGTLGQFAEAEQIGRQIVEWCMARHGLKNQRTAAALHLVARNVYAQGRLDEAAKIQEVALVSEMEVFGPDHPRAVESMVHFIQFEANRIAAHSNT